MDVTLLACPGVLLVSYARLQRDFRTLRMPMSLKDPSVAALDVYDREEWFAGDVAAEVFGYQCAHAFECFPGAARHVG